MVLCSMVKCEATRHYQMLYLSGIFRGICVFLHLPLGVHCFLNAISRPKTVILQTQDTKSIRSDEIVVSKENCNANLSIISADSQKLEGLEIRALVHAPRLGYNTESSEGAAIIIMVLEQNQPPTETPL